jgi:putative nucleotidyltransferase with HDIG domain
MGLPRKVESIDQAIAYLGDKALLQLIITAQTEMLLTNADKGYSLTRGGLYYHVLATARLCERISRNMRDMKPDLAYTAGLLHDIGKVVLDQYLANARPLFYRMMMERGEDSRTIEQKVLAIDHGHAGLMLAEYWDLPQVIKDVTIFHHCPEKAEGNADLVHLVHLADAITQKFLPGFIIENPDTSCLRESMDFLSLSDRDLRNAMGTLVDLF